MSDPATSPDPLAELPPAERAAAHLAERLRNEGLEPLLQLRLSDGDAQVARAALELLQEFDREVVVHLALDAATRLAPA